MSNVSMEKISYGGWPNCLRLSNGTIELIATTDVGPRLIRFGFVGGKNLFKEFPDVGTTGGESWKNYGGHRLWHAPEVRPRTYAPDNSTIGHEWDGTTLKLVQPVEWITGIQKEIEVKLDPSANQVTVLHRLVNKNLWPVEFAPWALTVMQGPGRAIFPQEPAGKELLPVRAMAAWGYTNMADKRWTWGEKFIVLKSDPAAQTPQKIGLGNSLGWVAYCADGQVFIKQYPFDSKARYPDFGCNTETYTRGDMLEVETLGALAPIEPGGKAEHVEHWSLHKADVGESESQIEAGLLPLIKA